MSEFSADEMKRMLVAWRPPDMTSIWQPVRADNLPPLDEIVWLWDGRIMWIGGRADDSDGWLWANTYGRAWHDGKKWHGDLETDDDYKPTHWMRMPQPPSAADSLQRQNA